MSNPEPFDDGRPTPDPDEQAIREFFRIAERNTVHYHAAVAALGRILRRKPKMIVGNEVPEERNPDMPSITAQGRPDLLNEEKAWHWALELLASDDARVLAKALLDTQAKALRIGRTELGVGRPR